MGGANGSEQIQVRVRDLKKVRFTIEFTTWAERDERELYQRLRGILKVAGRRFGLQGGRIGDFEEVQVRAEPGKGKGFVCAGWRSKSGQGRFW